MQTPNSWEIILQIAQQICSTQQHPIAALYIVATPIGNIADIGLRALHVLSLVDAIACEDTRHTQPLLRTYGLLKSHKPLLSIHQHNEAQSVADVIERLQKGERIALVTDAGTPAISDPGARLVAAVQQANFRTIPLPGASSITALMCVAGVVDVNPTQGHGGFEFIGFLSSKSTERSQQIGKLQHQSHAIVLLEAPHRIEVLAQALQIFGNRKITIGRELTKQFESVATLPAVEFLGWLQADVNRCRGEFVLVIHPETQQQSTAQSANALRVLQLLMQEVPLKTAVKLCSDITGCSKNELYAQALSLKDTLKV